jgi:hypothetical protein
VNRAGRTGELGEGPLSYIAVTFLIVAVVLALVLSGIGGTVEYDIRRAVCKIGEAGGLVDSCADGDGNPADRGTPTGGPTDGPSPSGTGPDPSDTEAPAPSDSPGPSGTDTPGPSGDPSPSDTGSPTPSASPGPSGSPSPSDTGEPNPTSGPVPTSSPSPSASPSPSPTPVRPVKRPEPVCTADGSAGYRDLTVVVPVRYVDVRGSVRVFYAMAKIVTPGKPDRWRVAIGMFGEGGVQAPDIGFLSSPWIGGNVTGMQFYNFDNEKDAREFPRRYAEEKAKWVARHHPMVAPLLTVPFLGDKLRDLLSPRDLPDPDGYSVEVGPAGGFNPKLKFGGFDLSAATRFWSLAGVQRDKDGNTIINLRDRVLTDPTLTFDLTKLPKQVTQRGAEAVLKELEMAGKAKFGPEFEIPEKLRDYINRSLANGVKAGITIELIGQNEYQYMLDKNGNPTKFTRNLLTSWTLRGRGNVTLGGGDGRMEIPVTRQIPLDGGRQLTSSSLDLSDPVHRNAALALLASGMFTQKVGIGSYSAQFTPIGEYVSQLMRTRGTMTRMTYDESVSGLSGGFEKLGKRNGAVRLDGEDNQTTLTRAEIWRDGIGWVPWDDCHR